MAVTFYCPICGADISKHAATTLSKHWTEWTKVNERGSSTNREIVRPIPEAPPKSFWFGYGRPDV